MKDFDAAVIDVVSDFLSLISLLSQCVTPVAYQAADVSIRKKRGAIRVRSCSFATAGEIPDLFRSKLVNGN